MSKCEFNELDLIEAFENSNMPPVLKGILEEIDTMNKKELKEFAKSVLLNLAELQDKYIALQRQHSAQSAEYLSRCRSVGGVTLPPGQ